MYSSTAVGFSSWKDGILRGKLYSTIYVSSMQGRRKVSKCGGAVRMMRAFSAPLVEIGLNDIQNIGWDSAPLPSTSDSPECMLHRIDLSR